MHTVWTRTGRDLAVSGALGDMTARTNPCSGAIFRTNRRSSEQAEGKFKSPSDTLLNTHAVGLLLVERVEWS